MGPTPTRIPTLGIRLSCNFVNVYTIAYCVQYTFTCVHACIPNGHPREDPQEEKRACWTSRRTSQRRSSCMSSSWQAEWGSRRTRRHPRHDPHVEVGSDVCVGVSVCVGPVEFQLLRIANTTNTEPSSLKSRLYILATLRQWWSDPSRCRWTINAVVWVLITLLPSWHHGIN